MTDPDATYRFSIRPLLTIYNDRFRRLKLEARILAYRDPALAAELCDLQPGTVRDYCLIFFDVVDRLNAPRAIDGKVIHQKQHAADYVRKELYRQAYFGGPAVAEHWLEHLPFLACLAEHDLTTPEGIERERLELILAASHPATAWKDPKHIDANARVLANQPVGRRLADLITEYQADVLGRFLTEQPAVAEKTVAILRAAA